MKPQLTIEGLRSSHAVPDGAAIVMGNGGLPKVVVNTPLCSGEIYLHGAHITSWKPANAAETIFVSKDSLWEDGRAIRGGIPICFPWFRNKADDPKAPQHGFARIRSWTLDSITAKKHGVLVEMSMSSDEDSRAWWQSDFTLTYRAMFGTSLDLELEMYNKGGASLHFEEALHTYHRVGNVENVQIDGLDGVTYLDNTDSNRSHLQRGAIVFTSQVDRAYVDTDHSIQLLDPQMGRRVKVVKTNSLTTVVWNPWKEGARSMIDMGDDEWSQMACIEASNIRDFAIDLQPGQQHTMRATILVEKL